jgi:hypothetical protein
LKGHNDWYILSDPRAANFDVCPTCYNKTVASTPYAQYFKPSPPKPADGAVRCDFSKLWVRWAWSYILTNRGDPCLLDTVANIKVPDGPCPGDKSEVRNWHSIVNPSDGKVSRDFTACSLCTASILAILPRLIGIFEPAGKSKAQCDLSEDLLGNRSAARKEWIMKCMPLLASAADRAVPNRWTTVDMSGFVKHIESKPIGGQISVTQPQAQQTLAAGSIAGQVSTSQSQVQQTPPAGTTSQAQPNTAAAAPSQAKPVPATTNPAKSTDTGTPNQTPTGSCFGTLQKNLPCHFPPSFDYFTICPAHYNQHIRPLPPNSPVTSLLPINPTAQVVSSWVCNLCSPRLRNLLNSCIQKNDFTELKSFVDARTTKFVETYNRKEALEKGIQTALQQQNFHTQMAMLKQQEVNWAQVARNSCMGNTSWVIDANVSVLSIVSMLVKRRWGGGAERMSANHAVDGL